MEETPVLGVIGGSGLYQIEGLTETKTLDVDTPFGKPSAPIVVGTLENRRVAFLARHGIGHHISPSEVNYRANIYALKMLGVERILSISACGSLRDDFAPGHIVIPDQLMDFTRLRERSFFEDGLVTHISSADPFCPQLSSQLLAAVNEVGGIVHRGGTLITIEGPRFSTRAESNVFRAWGMSLIGMTACPEAFLAREAEMCYTTMAHVTDYDSWHTTEEPVSVDMVVQTLNHNTALAQEAVKAMVRQLPTARACECGSALATAFITAREAIPPQTREKLDLLVKKYL
ncbi:MAG: S-methyl-5'-thioadenosine phosphorylase [Anaerolineaceae bacterium]